MAAAVFAASTPYATLAEADGRFSFDEVESGAYVITAYVAGRRLQQAIDVKPGVIEVTLQ
jgi:hypothetical protein